MTSKEFKHVSRNGKQTLCGLPLSSVKYWAIYHCANNITCIKCKALLSAYK